MIDELKPCPFCGATDEVMTTRDFWSGAIPAEAEVANQVGCTVCDIWTPAFDTKEEGWNWGHSMSKKMTATERLRQLLDERGVEWTYGDGTVSFDNGERWFHAWAYNDGMMCVSMGYLTPEQAVEATLGPREQPPYEELIEALRRDWDIEASWDGLRRFWYVGLTDEGVRKRDEREATLGRGTCKDICNSVSEFTCSTCGFNCDLTSWISLFNGDEGRHRHHHHGTPNYCPNCGAEVEQ